MLVRLAFFINFNGKTLQVEHCLCLKYVMVYRLTCEIQWFE